jgi:prolyl oligopeptidase
MSSAGWVISFVAVWCGVAIGSQAMAIEARDPRIPQDSYSWLMPQYAEKAVAWAKQQTAATSAKLEAMPEFEAVLRDMREVQATSTVLPDYHLVGRKYIRFVHDKAHPYGSIETAAVGGDGRAIGPWRQVFDLDTYNKTAPQPYTIKWINPTTECLAPEYSRCMLPLWPNGAQNVEYREFDLSTGKFVAGGFHIAPSRTMVSWLDADTLLAAHTSEGAPAMPSQFPAELHLWKRGTPLVQARTIFKVGPTDSLFQFFLAGAPGRRKIIVSLAKTYTEFQLEEVTPEGQATDLSIPTELKEFGKPVFTNNKVVVQLATAQTIDGKSYPADSIIAYDLATRRTSLVMAPPEGTYLTGGYTGSRRGLTIVATRNLQRILYTATPSRDGWDVKQRLTEQPGATLSVAGDEAADAVLLKEQGFLVPPRASLLTFGVEPSVIDAAKPVMDLSDYTVDIRSVRSNDGISIDYYLMHKKTKAAGATPTILEGYGGFAVSDEPRYFGYRLGSSWKTWYARGGAFVVAAVRGGGERGGAWHLAGAGPHKKQMFDDFNAVAEDLEHSGFTSPQHLGILGHSNGGMLTAGAEVLRPDLYSAALVGAPVTDLFILGHGDGGIGAGMKTEVGDGDDPAQIPYILTWSPYQNVKPGVRYPNTLVVVATTDNQVGPSHARKFVAKLQEAGAPALLLEGAVGGHDYPDEYTQTKDTAMEMTFLVDALMKP